MSRRAPACTRLVDVKAADEEPLAFAQLLLGIIDEGRRTATYKLALLLALLDCSVLGTDGLGQPSSRISTRVLARRVVHLYWPQVRPFPVDDRTELVLSQSSQPRAVSIDAVARLRGVAGRGGVTTVHLAEERYRREYEACVDRVEHNFVQMPLGRLQRPAGSSADYLRFLYDDAAFHEGVTLAQLRRQPLHVVLQPGVADVLLSLSGLVRPLLELHWTREVARFNKRTFGEDRLRDFLFGASRTSLQGLLPGLIEVQRGACFYCRMPLARGASDVDHFIPWSRVPNDSLANLVLAHRGCNNAKRDHFAALRHLERFAVRPDGPLAEVAASQNWPLGLVEARQTALSLYAHLPEGSQTWDAPGVFAVLDPVRRDQTLRLLAQGSSPAGRSPTSLAPPSTPV